MEHLATLDLSGPVTGFTVRYPENPSQVIYSHTTLDVRSPRARAVAVARQLAFDAAANDMDTVIKKHANRVVDALVRHCPQWANEINVAYREANRRMPAIFASARPIDWKELEKTA